MNSATSASTFRLTRYERDRLSLAATPVSGRWTARPAGSCAWIRVADGVDVDAGPKTQVDAGDAAQPIEVRLGAGDIHHRESLLHIGGHQSGDAQASQRASPT